MSDNKLTEDKFLQGMTTQQYIDQIKVNKQPFEDIYQAAEVPSRVQAAFDGLAEPLRLAVFTADWCGDAMSTTPVILRLADSTSKISHQVFNRDDELELTNSFLAEDRAGTVPVFVVLDSDMNEIARFVETANELVPSIDAMDETISQEIASQPAEEARAAGRARRTEFRVSRAREWGEVILTAFEKVVAEGLTLPQDQRPAISGTKWPYEP